MRIYIYIYIYTRRARDGCMWAADIHRHLLRRQCVVQLAQVQGIHTEPVGAAATIAGERLVYVSHSSAYAYVRNRHTIGAAATNTG